MAVVVAQGFQESASDTRRAEMAKIQIERGKSDLAFQCQQWQYSGSGREPLTLEDIYRQKERGKSD